jgi:DNA-directed RNA polymerase subunit RPC12/RpoP
MEAIKMRCYFCGKLIYGEEKIRLVGKQDGKRRQKTTYVCITCSAMADYRWFEEQLDWDEGSLKVKGVK